MPADIKNCRRIAVFGGAFDPVHNGHLMAAEEARHRYNLDMALFVPTNIPPHKPSEGMASAERRYLMCLKAVSGNPRFAVSRIEIDRPGHSYTADTLRQIKEICRKDAKIYIIVGADAIRHLLSWKDAEYLMSSYHFIAATRPGCGREELRGLLDGFKGVSDGKFCFMEMPSLDISSSDIRDRAFIGKPIKYLVPENVEAYIRKTGLYSCPGIDRRAIDRKLKKALTDKRYAHTLGVAEEAVKLARRYSADKRKALLAALLHDCAKNFNNEENSAFIKESGAELEHIRDKYPSVLHAFVGAEAARRDYGVKDEEVINAVRYHTTGRPNMTPLEKIIYMADCLDPGRSRYPGADNLRELAYENLDKAVRLVMRDTIVANERKGAAVHHLSREALEFLEGEVK